MGPVELTVSDLERSLEYWQRDIGLQLLAREDGTAALGGAEPLVRLVEEPGARPADGFAASQASVCGSRIAPPRRFAIAK